MSYESSFNKSGNLKPYSARPYWRDPNTVARYRSEAKTWLSRLRKNHDEAKKLCKVSNSGRISPDIFKLPTYEQKSCMWRVEEKFHEIDFKNDRDIFLVECWLEGWKASRIEAFLEGAENHVQLPDGTFKKLKPVGRQAILNSLDRLLASIGETNVFKRKPRNKNTKPNPRYDFVKTCRYNGFRDHFKWLIFEDKFNLFKFQFQDCPPDVDRCEALRKFSSEHGRSEFVSFLELHIKRTTERSKPSFTLINCDLVEKPQQTVSDSQKSDINQTA